MIDSNNKSNQMIPSLTSFRFITALVVFLFHCKIHFGWTFGVSIIDKFIRNGAVFMTGFFVLSGFLMAHNYGTCDFSKKENILIFYLKRFARIYPAYIISHIVYFLVFLHRFSIKDLIRTALNDLTLVQGFFQTMFNIGMNGGSWSLTVEMFLYFLFPFIIILSVDEKGKSKIHLIIIAFILSFLISLNVMLQKDGDYIYANPVFRIPDFLYGVGFYFLIEKLNFGQTLHCISHFIILLIIFFLTLSLGHFDFRYMKGQVFIIPVFATWITLAFYSKSWFYNNKLLEYLGKISYSFYLWQFVVIELGKKLIKYFDDDIVMISMLCLNIFISALSYHLLEKNCRQWILNRFLKEKNSGSGKID